MERIRPAKPRPKKYRAWLAPTIKNVCRQESRIRRLEEEAEKIRRRFAAAPELTALYVELNGSIPFYFTPRPPRAGKPRLVVDNKPVRRPFARKTYGGGPEAA